MNLDTVKNTTNKFTFDFVAILCYNFKKKRKKDELGFNNKSKSRWGFKK